MCGWIGNGMPARSARRAISAMALGRHRAAALGSKYMRARRLFALHAAQGADLVTLDPYGRYAFRACCVGHPISAMLFSTSHSGKLKA
jgi:hypothetical protein